MRRGRRAIDRVGGSRRGRRTRATSARCSTPAGTATSPAPAKAGTASAASSTPAATRPAPKSSGRSTPRVCPCCSVPPQHGSSPTDAGVTGVLVFDERGAGVVHAPAVLLATGGLGQLYACSTNPPGATADGIALALRGRRGDRRSRVRPVPPHGAVRRRWRRTATAHQRGGPRRGRSPRRFAGRIGHRRCPSARRPGTA